MANRKDNKGRILLKGESQRADGRYMYRYTDIHGERQTEYSWRLVETDPHPKEKKWDMSLREKQKQIVCNTADSISYTAGKMTLNELFDSSLELRYRTKKIKASTYQNYKSVWDKNIRNTTTAAMEISDLRKNNFLSLYQELFDKEVGKGSINLMRKVICSILNYAVEEDYIRKNYALGCHKEFDLYLKQRKALTKEQQEAFLNFVEKDVRYKKQYWLFVFMLETAVRVGEMAGLTRENLDLENGVISIKHQLSYTIAEKESNKSIFFISPPKSYRSIREIPLNAKAKQALEMQLQYLKENGLEENFQVDNCKDFIFLNQKDNLWNAIGLCSKLHSIIRAYNQEERIIARREERPPVLLPNISAHILRHTACTRMAEYGIDIRVLQEIMGHDSVNVTMKVYNHVDKPRMKSEIQRIDELRTKQVG